MELSQEPDEKAAYTNSRGGRIYVLKVYSYLHPCGKAETFLYTKKAAAHDLCAAVPILKKLLLASLFLAHAPAASKPQMAWKFTRRAPKMPSTAVICCSRSSGMS